MDVPFAIGTRLVIELKCNQIFEGDLIKLTKERIDVANVMEYPQRIYLPDRFLSFYEMDIISICALQNKLSVTEVPCENVIAIPKDDYARLMSMAENYIYLPVIDKNYLAAIDDLKRSETIGVVGLPNKHGRMQRLTLLVLSTWCHVYIFDLQFNHSKIFPPELKAILESDYQQKVVHDSQKLFDCLVHCHKVKISNLFDVKIADFQILWRALKYQPERFRDLPACLAFYFNLPSSFLGDAMNVDVSEWKQRPLTNLIKWRAARLASHLIYLKNTQEEILLRDCYKTMEIFSQGG